MSDVLRSLMDVLDNKPPPVRRSYGLLYIEGIGVVRVYQTGRMVTVAIGEGLDRVVSGGCWGRRGFSLSPGAMTVEQLRTARDLTREEVVRIKMFGGENELFLEARNAC